MARTPFTVVVGNPKARSRTRAVGFHVAWMVAEGLADAGVPVRPHRLVDLAELGPDLVGHGDPERLAEAMRAVRAPGGLLLVASPTFKAAYTGLLKLFVDLLPRGALTGVVAIPVMTAASPAHRHVVDRYLAPLLVEVGAIVPAPGLCVLEADFGRLDTAAAGWCAAAVPALAAALAPTDQSSYPAALRV